MAQQKGLRSNNNFNLTKTHSSFPLLSPHLNKQQSSVHSKQIRLRKKKIYNPLISKGKWTQKEQQAYISFLQQNYQNMETSLKRKSKKVFVRMSQKVQTRDADQCRSHHQKMILYRSSVAKIIQYYRNDALFGQESQRLKLKEQQNAAANTLNTNPVKDTDLEMMSNGHCIRIFILTSKIKTYDFGCLR